MGRKKQDEIPFPEMSELFEGMQDLLTDEEGNPITPDHPQYNKLTGIMKLMADNMDSQSTEDPLKDPKGHA